MIILISAATDIAINPSGFSGYSADDNIAISIQGLKYNFLCPFLFYFENTVKNCRYFNLEKFI
jgi:hypothetical protein